MNNNMTAIEVYEEMLCVSPKEAKQYFDACVEHMDDEIREKLHGQHDEEQSFLSAYCKKHFEEFEEKFVVN